MLKKILIGLAALLVVLGTLAWFNKPSIILFLVAHSGGTDVAPNQEIAWSQGPEDPQTKRADGPPNIIFIVADDLGINDISTFGGGVAASCRPPTSTGWPRGAQSSIRPMPERGRARLPGRC